MSWSTTGGVATVDTSGNVTAIANGSGTVTASFHGQTATSSITTSVSGTPTTQFTVGGTTETNGSTYVIGTTNVGQPVDTTFTINNTGTAPLVLGAITVPSGFSVTSSPTSPVLPGGSTSLTVRLSATTPGTYSGTLSIATNDTSGSYSLYLSGAVAALYNTTASLGISDTSGTFAFPATPYGSTSSHTVVLAATGGGAASAIAFSGLSGAYSITSNNCSTSLGALQSCTFIVSYNPNNGVSTAGNVLTIGYTDSSGSYTVTDTFSGSGINDALLSLGSSSVSFGNVAKNPSPAPTQTVTLSNAAGGASASGISVGGLSGVLSQTNNCGTSLSAGASCSITITYSPTTVASASETLTVLYNNGAAATSTTAAVTGAGVADAVLSLSDTSGYTFPNTAVNPSSPPTHAITVSNAAGGASASSLSIAGLSGALSETNTCPTSLAAGSTCTITAKFDPTTVTTTSETLTVSYNNGSTTTNVTDALSGTGLSGTPAASNSTVVASQTAVIDNGSATSTITVTLLNSSNNPISGKTVGLSASGGSSTIAAVSATTNTSGQATFTVKDTTLETITYTATDTTDSVTVSQTAQVSFILAPGNISSGTTGYHTCVLSSAGNVYCWGDDSNGQLGNNSTATAKTPVKVLGVGGSGVLSNITAVSAGAYNTCALSSAGNVYCWGTNQYGDLGNGTSGVVVNSTPIEVESTSGSGYLSNIVAIGSGDSHHCAVSSAGNVYCWGYNGSGQIGNGTTTEQNLPVEVEGVGGSGSLSGIVSVAGGSYSTCALSSGGNVYCWGSSPVVNSTTPVEIAGVGGSGYLSGIASLATGAVHVCALSTAGNVYCWGQNESGELGNGTTTTESNPVEVEGPGGSGYLSGITSIIAGESSTCGVSSSGNVYCWGWNTGGQLGNNSTTNSSVPVEVLGVGGTGNLSGIAAIAAGTAWTCGLSSIGNVFCWGDNYDGALGNNSTTNSNVPVQVQVQGLSGGSGFFSTGTISPAYLSASPYSDNDMAHTCAVSNTGYVYCWGDNDWAQLGNGSQTLTQSTPVQVAGVGGSGNLSSIVSVTSGGYHTCALSSSGNVYCWGSNDYGQLGNNSSTNQFNTPVQVLTGAQGASSGNLSNIVAVGAGMAHSCALTSGGNVYCWGYNAQGQLGNNSTTNVSTPVKVVSSSGSALSGIISIAIAGFQSCALDSSGKAWCWGNNASGQIGIGSSSGSYSTPQAVTVSGFVSLGEGANHVCGVTTAGNVYCWGDNLSGDLGNGTTSISGTPVEVSAGAQGSGYLSNIIAVTGGNDFSCAIDSSGKTWCWGGNTDGDLGNGTTTKSTTPVLSGAANLVSVTGGYYHACGLTNSGAVQCWGDNDYGQLGNSSTTNSSSPVSVKGVGGSGNLGGI